MIRTLSILLAAVVWASAASAVDFTDHVTIPDRHCVDSAPLGDATLVLTTDGLWLVDWTRPRAGRDRCLAARPLRETPLYAWGDSLVALAPKGQGGHLIVHRGPDGEPVIEEIADPDWLPVEAWLGGRPWFLDTATGGDARLVPALGEPGVPLPVPSSAGYYPRLAAFTGTKLVMGRVLASTYDPSFMRAWDLADPEHPVVGPEVEVGRYLTDLVAQKNVVFLSLETLESWSLMDVANPTRLAAFGPAGSNRYLTLGPGDRLASWFAGSIVRLVDVRNPSAPRNVIMHTLDTAANPYVRGVDAEADRVLVRQGNGTRALRLPQFAGGLVADLGWAWPTLDDPRGIRLATDGRYAWIQSGERLVADLDAGTMVPSPDADTAEDGSRPDFLAWHKGCLLSAPGDGRLVCEDVTDPVHPVRVWQSAPTTPVSRACLDGDDLGAQVGNTIVVFDVSSPRTARARGGVTLERSDDMRWTLCGGLLLVAQEYPGPPAYYQTWDVVLHVYDIRVDASFREVAALDLDYNDDRWYLGPLVTVGDDVFVYGMFYSWAWMGHLPGAVRIDLADPTHPSAGYPEGTDLYPNGANLAFLSTPSGLGVVDLEWDGVQAALYDGTEPSSIPPLATVALASLRALATPVRGRVVVVTGTSVDAFLLDGLGLSAVGPTPPVLPGLVRAVPNPFNPSTMLSFEVRVAGPVHADIFDLAGRRIRTLTAELPAGPAALPWDGRDDDGRAVASGVYLVRAEAGGEPQRGRCVLVR